MDLGAPPRAVIRRILLLYPAIFAIFASFAIAFADSLAFVTVRYLSCPPAVDLV